MDEALGHVLSRRRLLGVGAAAAALVATRPFAGVAAAKQCTATVKDTDISIQLFTTLLLANASPEATLTALREIGYTKVEHAGFGSAVTAANFRTACDNAGIKCTSGHMTIGHPYNDTAWKTTVEDALTVGQIYINAASKSAGGNTKKDWIAYARTLNKAGAVARKEGIKHIGHHCHGGEWQPVDDDPKLRPVDILVKYTNPKHVHVQNDLGWCFSVTDPVPQLKKFPGRFWQFHVKDMRGGFPTYPGTGEIGPDGFRRMFGAAKESKQPGLTELIIEQDAAATGLEAAKLGWDMLHGMEYSYKC
ncbi:MAG TPA: TIM barrel protein [Actinomycetota bacterium]|jgi:sugar phosphate isomerase/epimerase|nr:TIM barrel protein [Actinomycetota bacterium]